jgi:fyn-related kinase
VVTSISSWYFGTISRVTSEKNLRHHQNRSGAFLIRDSETFKGNYVLSVINRGNINHYRIRCTDKGEFFIGKTQRCKSLQALVNYHAQPGCGIPERLVKPCVQFDVPVLHELSHHDEWEIDRASIKLKAKLGSGQFGDVFQGVWNNNTKVAVKTLKSGTRMNRNEFLEEAKIMKQLRHPKLVQLYAVVTVGEPVYIVTELMSFGSLLSVLRSADQHYANYFRKVIHFSFRSKSKNPTRESCRHGRASC